MVSGQNRRLQSRQPTVNRLKGPVEVKTEMLYGIHPVSEALSAGRRRFAEIYIAQDSVSKRIKDTVDLAKSLNIPVKKITSAQLRAMVGSGMHQGIGASVSTYQFADVFDMLAKPNAQAKPHFLLLLDNIVDPHNLGALIRTANCVGIDGVIIPKDRSAQPSPAVSKISSGALEHVMIARVTNMSAVIGQLVKSGIWIVGMEGTSDSSLFDADLTGPVAIVVGGEEKGIRPLVKKSCDFLISIPQIGQVDSLNASVAGGIVMYEVYRQRMHAGKNR